MLMLSHLCCQMRYASVWVWRYASVWVWRLLVDVSSSQVEPVPELRWDGQGTPLAAVPLPVCSGPLLSDWPVQCSRFIRRYGE